ncbi:MAG: trypsin-like peptidase domain-containing protein [Pirellulales bacterium]
MFALLRLMNHRSRPVLLAGLCGIASSLWIGELDRSRTASAQQPKPNSPVFAPPTDRSVIGRAQPLTGGVTSTSTPNTAPVTLTLSDGAVPEGLTPEEVINTSVYANCNRCVVHIETHATHKESFFSTSVREGSGSGSIIDQQGHILTNHHVIEGAKEITVSLFNGLKYPAVTVGQDADTDIAVLRIDAPAAELHPIRLGDSQNLLVGQRIYAIGNPFGLERTMSTGIISSLNRQIPSGQHRTMRSLIQIDAALNQGNSGGPLINTRSELIGMNTAIMSTGGDSAGVGFAIPVSTIRRIVPALIRDGKIVRPTIGISRVYENNGGLLVVSLVPGGPAEKAGLKGFSLITKTYRQGLLNYSQSVVDPTTADMITAMDGTTVKTADDLLAVIESKKPGDVVEVTVDRSGKPLTARITLGAAGN